MSTQNTNKTKAALKIVFGVAKIVSGGALACGHGLLAAIARKPLTRIHIATIQVQSGEKIVKEGWRDWQSLK